EYIKEKNLGPDALEVNKQEFVNILKNKNSLIKSALTDQTALSGIGNVYADEILYQAKVHPRERTSKISEAKMNKLFEEMNRVLKTAIDKNAEVSKMPNDFLLPVRDKDNSCPGCKGKLEIIKISGRTTYYCPSCQKLSDG
ncbi:MAG: NFACT family protein, partial [Bacteroidota bacterium]